MNLIFSSKILKKYYCRHYKGKQIIKKAQTNTMFVKRNRKKHPF